VTSLTTIFDVSLLYLFLLIQYASERELLEFSRDLTIVGLRYEERHHLDGLTIAMARTERRLDFIALAKTLTSTPWCDDYEKMISGML
jgi:hypothetical protein